MPKKRQGRGKGKGTAPSKADKQLVAITKEKLQNKGSVSLSNPFGQPRRRQGKHGPNDPCDCGSGKKWKKCGEGTPSQRAAHEDLHRQFELLNESRTKARDFNLPVKKLEEAEAAGEGMANPDEVMKAQRGAYFDLINEMGKMGETKMMGNCNNPRCNEPLPILQDGLPPVICAHPECTAAFCKEKC